MTSRTIVVLMNNDTICQNRLREGEKDDSTNIDHLDLTTFSPTEHSPWSCGLGRSGPCTSFFLLEPSENASRKSDRCRTTITFSLQQLLHLGSCFFEDTSSKFLIFIFVLLLLSCDDKLAGTSPR
jgi:hypothetical protein